VSVDSVDVRREESRYPEDEDEAGFMLASGGRRSRRPVRYFKPVLDESGGSSGWSCDLVASSSSNALVDADDDVDGDERAGPGIMSGAGLVDTDTERKSNALTGGPSD
jgi:hypothetical protein